MAYELLWPYGSQVSKPKLIYTSKIRLSERPTIASPRDAAQLFLQHWNHIKIREREEFKCMYLDHSYRVLGISEVGLGDETSVVVKDKLMFSIAYQLCAHWIILCHNHPSGSMNPSDADKGFTSRVRYSADIMKFRILDHIILSPFHRYYSFVGHDLIGCHENLRYWKKGKEELAKPLYRDSLIRTAA